MNLVRLKQAEEAFLGQYPGGFDNPEMIVQNIIKVVSRSSVISRFEKPKFREFADTLFPEQRDLLAGGLEQLLHGKEHTGFETILDLLKSRKLAKWSLMTICQTYFHPQRDVLVKPNTVKGIIQYFELNDLQYKPTPAWNFYDSYRSILHEMKSKVDCSLSPTNAAF